nr:MAG TPA: hypothetical protein [Caudoviricetes sp.]
MILFLFLVNKMTLDNYHHTYHNMYNLLSR